MNNGHEDNSLFDLNGDRAWHCCSNYRAGTSSYCARSVTEIRKQVGVEWEKDTVDTFKAGDPVAAVTGIAVTMMATMDVLERASAKGLNFVITHEPTFYAHLDTPEGMQESDPVWAEKWAFIENGGFTITGTCTSRMELKQEWCVRLSGRNFKALRANIQYLFVMPETTVKKLAAEVANRLDSPGGARRRSTGDEGYESGI